MQFSIDDETRGEEIVTDLLRDQLVACAQKVGPLTSRYRWQGQIEEAREWLYVCKTASDRLADVIECIRVRHPYEVPEIVADDITGGLGAYLEWIVAQTRPPSAPA